MKDYEGILLLIFGLCVIAALYAGFTTIVKKSFNKIAPKEKIQEFKIFLDEKNGKDWFDFFLPCPQELKDVGEVSVNYTNEQLGIAKVLILSGL